MAKSELKDMIEQIDVEDFLCHLGIDFKITHGSSGTQANIKECPRCGGTKWKVYIGVDEGLGNCFHGSCQGEPGFNIFTFTKALLGSGQKAYSEISGYSEANSWIPDRKRRHAPVLIETPEVKLPKSYPLPINGKNLKYLAGRGITSNICEQLHLRFCKEGRFNYELAGEKRFQDYSNRVIIPIFDINGELVTFQGRDIIGRSEKKYLFPPGLPSTGKHLYNCHNVVGCSTIVIGEGAFDVAAILIAFNHDPNLKDIGVVGSFGKNLSTQGNNGSQIGQLMTLKANGLKTVVIMWDGEESALNEACKTALMIKSHGLSARVAILPKDKDPNEVDPDVVRLAFYRSEPANAISMAKLRLKLMT